MKKVVPSEAFEHRLFVDWLRSMGLQFHHSPNGGPSKRQNIKAKGLGTSPGFPDLLVCIPPRLLAIELKRVKGGRVSPEQKEWLKILNSCGVTAVVCYGYKEARKVVEECLKL